jgi:hypothetical protein
MGATASGRSMTELTSPRSGELAATNSWDEPFVRPCLAFRPPPSQLHKHGQRPITAQAVPSTANNGAPWMSEAELAWALADAVSVCFTANEHLGIYAALGAGETYSAIARMLDVAVGKRYPLPATLVSALAAWLDCYIGHEHEPTTRSLLNHVEPQAPPTTAPPRRATVRSSNPSNSIGEPG